MRRSSRSGGFWLVYLFNMVLNFRLTIPGWILLILHFIIPQYIKWWYCLAYFGAFLLYILIWMLILRALGRWVSTAEPAPPIENKNPYSAQSYAPIRRQNQIVNKNPYSKGSAPVQKSDNDPQGGTP